MMSDESTSTPSSEPPKKSLAVLGGLLLLSIGAFFSLVLIWLSQPPSTTVSPATVMVEKGASVRTIAATAKSAGVVRSELLLYMTLTALYDPTNIYAGRYIFDEPLTVFAVAQKFASNQVDEPLITLTVPEGVTARKIAMIASSTLPEFNTDEYLRLTEGQEGFLFPETYFVPETFSARDLYALQVRTFAEKVGELTADKTETDIREHIILASIIEREANSEASMKMVSGILKNRMAAGMPLQADVTIEYVLETPLKELPPGEHARLLDELDTPYNTYRNVGLPPTAIGNPGLIAIDAAFNPTESDYYYYITDEEGNFHYAKTLDEHNRNVAEYLR